MLFIPAALPLLRITFPHLPWFHHMLIPLFITPPYLFLHLSRSTSSTITRSNHRAALKRYPYDHTIFHGSNDLRAPCIISPTSPSPLATPTCRTCQLAKPARSKHCSICRACVQKADHHCVWINNCVGRNNYLYFLVLMLSLTLLLAYGAYLGYQILHVQIQLQRSSSLPSSSPSSASSLNPHWSKHLSWSSYTQQWSAMIADHPLIAAPALLALLSFPLALGLMLYHVYLIWAGMTTNESGKWADLREDIGEGRVWRGKVEELRGDFREWGLESGSESGRGNGGRSGGDDCGFEWPVMPTWVVVRMEAAGRGPRVRKRRGKGNTNMDGEIGPMDGNSEQWEEDERWTQVRRLSEIVNIYDLGFWDNLKDVLLNRE
ncbi:hypothetical protein EPUS_04233 [Endocarpon pusillum Z07020]|uniref:Palmitoyltransferase n=1 Tax=Endocarpon pusillum (strain Z07020 / HMAS-L-300199) TaxID=1263415 RepID=U1GKR2_ENDPU|nr:uncharacterized protein EPUS_04233 [Endocarpon pusillum Z07020]ERF72798.1 hypothetical protein EPUS_04233 [Endocarpon pusillum Z07020]